MSRVLLRRIGAVCVILFFTCLCSLIKTSDSFGGAGLYSMDGRFFIVMTFVFAIAAVWAFALSFIVKKSETEKGSEKDV